MSIQFEYWYLLVVLAFAVRGFITARGIDDPAEGPQRDPRMLVTAMGIVLVLIVQYITGFDCRWCVFPWIFGVIVGNFRYQYRLRYQSRQVRKRTDN